MIRFTDQELVRLRQKAKEDPTIVQRLKNSCQTVFSRPITAVRWTAKFSPGSPMTDPGGAAAAG